MRSFFSVFIIICLVVFPSLNCEKENDVTEPETTNACPGTPYVSYAGKTYSTVQIGNQCWIGENLDAGIMIGGYSSQRDNDTIEKYCYNNDPENCRIYGGLYQWNEAMKYTSNPGAGGICPPGWHIPAFTEFQQLSRAVGDDCNALKAIGEGTGDGMGTDTTGFGALLAGFRDNLGYFALNGSFAFFWSSTEYNLEYTRYVFLDSPTNVNGMYDSFNKNYGFSVRCLKN